MLHTIAELAEHGLRHVEGILRDEINADAFRARQPHHQLDPFQHMFGRIVE